MEGFHVMKILARSAVSMFLCTSVLLAQNGLQPVTSAPRHAGVYHVATGTWTRNSSLADLGADIVYNNTCPTNYYLPLNGNVLGDDGRLPSPSSPVDSRSRPGCASSYTIQGFDIALCLPGGHSTTWTFSFYEVMSACEPAVVPPTASFTLPIPSGAGIPLNPVCWIVSIDTSGLPPTAPPFTLQADGDGTYGTLPDTFRFELSGTNSFGLGPFTAGSPQVCSAWDGTRWDDGTGTAWPLNVFEPGTGMGNSDLVRRHPGPGSSDPPLCDNYDYGELDLHAGVYLKLYADACAPSPYGLFCSGDGTATACPCGNIGPPGAGCKHSGLNAGKLRGFGEASLSADTFVLLGLEMTPGSNALYFQGTMQMNGGSGAVFGDGLRCIGGALARIAVVTNGLSENYGASRYPEDANDPSVHQLGQITQPGTRYYQILYRNFASYCTPAAFNLSQGLSVTWTN
jgi:hypothetical protein